MKKFIAVSLAVILTFSISPSHAANTQAGAMCSKIGLKQISAGKEFTCVSKGSKNVWNSGTVLAKYKPKGYAGSRCEKDPLVNRGQAAQIQNFLSDYGWCVQAMRIAKSSLPTSQPTSSLSQKSMESNNELCKIQNDPNSRSWKGFPDPQERENFTTERHPSPGTVMQIIPIYSSDAPVGKGSPYQDYQFYFDFIVDYYKYIDDSGLGIDLRVPEKYLEFPEEISKFGITHGVDGELATGFAQKVINAVDQHFDFSDVDYALIVVPGGTPSKVMGQQGFPRIKSAEGYMTNVSTAQPATFRNTRANSRTPYFTAPILWLHEFYHPGMNLGDNLASRSSKYDEGRGMGDWGLMSNHNGDLLAWQKWILGFITDSQVHCISPDQEATLSWIAPSSIKTQKEKLVVIPLSKSKAIIVESIRAVGLNYRLRSPSLGALAYVVDAGDTRHEYGYTVLYPDKRRPKDGSIFLMEDAPLKAGEAVTIEGVKITNVEWGDYGDVIKVEPVK